MKMKYLDMAPYEQGEYGYMLDGEEVTNFKIGYEGSILDIGTEQYSYRIGIEIDGDQPVPLEIPAKNINRRTWLSQIPKAVWFADQEKFLKIFRKALVREAGAKRPIRYDTDRTGFCTVEGKLVFAFSNGAITGEGFDKSIRSKMSGYDFSGDLERTTKELPELLDCLSQNIKVLYPVFCTNLLAASCQFFDRHGIDLALTLWLQGNSGSGKTTLAKTLGAFIGKDHRGRKIISSTEQTGNVRDSLAAGTGLTFIYDDVKTEKTQRQREKRNASTDIVIRSVYQHECTEGRAGKAAKYVATCAIITGEYMETTESQNARLMFLDMSEFIQDPDDRKALTRLQEHPEWVADVVGGFIQWLISKDSGDGAWVAQVKGIERDLRKQSWSYEAYPNGQRLKDSQSRMLLVTRLFRDFILERTSQDPEEILEEMCDSIFTLTSDTFAMLGGVKAVALMIMEEIVGEAVEQEEVREADYINTYYDAEMAWEQDQFYYLYDEDTQTGDVFLYIPEVERSFEYKDHYGEPQQESSLLIIRREGLERRLREKMERYIEEGSLSRNVANKIDIPLLGKMGMILVRDRTDGTARYDREYPMLSYTRKRPFKKYISNRDGVYECGEWKASMIQCALEHPVFQRIVKGGSVKKRSPEFGIRPGGDRDDRLELRRRFHQGKFRLNM